MWLPWLLRNNRPFIFKHGPLGPHPSTAGVCLPFWMCGWSIPITLPNESQVAAWLLRKSRPFIFKFSPQGPTSFNIIWHIYHCRYVDIRYLWPHWNRAKWLPCLLWKGKPLLFKYRLLGAHVLQNLAHIYKCGCMDHQCLSPYQTRAKWLPWLLRKSRPFIFKYRPLLGLTYFNIWGIFTIVGVWVINTYHHTKK